jgi:hypothetical protein
MRRFHVLPALLVFVAGCSGTGIYPVEGQVVYTDGSPAADLKGCSIEFDALDNKLDGKSVGATGEIDAEGKFRLTTRKANDGAVAGRHRVLISDPNGGLGRGPTKLRVAKKYETFDTSGLEQTVEPKANTLTVTVERIPK